MIRAVHRRWGEREPSASRSARDRPGSPCWVVGSCATAPSAWPLTWWWTRPPSFVRWPSAIPGAGRPTRVTGVLRQRCHAGLSP